MQEDKDKLPSSELVPINFQVTKAMSDAIDAAVKGGFAVSKAELIRTAIKKELADLGIIIGEGHGA